jgi:hypothetical protein
MTVTQTVMEYKVVRTDKYQRSIRDAADGRLYILGNASKFTYIVERGRFDGDVDGLIDLLDSKGLFDQPGQPLPEEFGRYDGTGFELHVKEDTSDWSKWQEVACMSAATHYGFSREYREHCTSCSS